MTKKTVYCGICKMPTTKGMAKIVEFDYEIDGVTYVVTIVFCSLCISKCRYRALSICAACHTTDLNTLRADPGDGCAYIVTGTCPECRGKE